MAVLKDSNLYRQADVEFVLLPSQPVLGTRALLVIGSTVAGNDGKWCWQRRSSGGSPLLCEA